MPELTIASYNIRWGYRPKRDGGRPFDVVAACRKLDADVLVLQESWAPDGERSDHQRVAEGLDMEVAAELSLARSVVEPVPRVQCRTSVDPQRGDGGWYLAILSRLPVLAGGIHRLPHLPADHADRAVLSAQLAVDGSVFHAHGTHLPHLEYGAHLSTRGLRRGLPPTDVPAAFIGDMNMWGWTIDRMVPTGWRRVVRGKTWPAHRPHHQIDHLLVTPPVTALSSQVGPHFGSDHLPIRARLRW